MVIVGMAHKILPGIFKVVVRINIMLEYVYKLMQDYRGEGEVL